MDRTSANAPAPGGVQEAQRLITLSVTGCNRSQATQVVNEFKVAASALWMPYDWCGGVCGIGPRRVALFGSSLVACRTCYRGCGSLEDNLLTVLLQLSTEY